MGSCLSSYNLHQHIYIYRYISTDIYIRTYIHIFISCLTVRNCYRAICLEDRVIWKRVGELKGSYEGAIPHVGKQFP